MEQALAYVCCPADESRAKVQKYCRKIYELGYVPICPQYAFAPFLDDGAAEEQQDKTKMSRTMNAEISMADRLHIICTTLDGLIKIKEAE